MSIPVLTQLSPTQRRIAIVATAVAVFAIGVAVAMALWPRDEASLAVASPAPEPSEEAPESTPSPTPSPSPTPDILAPGEVIATTAVENLNVYSEPGGDITHTLDEWSEQAFQPLTLMAVDRTTRDDEEWLLVDLPVQPNGTRGWIRTDDVTVSSTTVALHIYLDDRQLELRDDDEVLLSTDVVIGDPETPTPPGTYYITDPLGYPNPAGVYGAYALGLSGFSEVLDSFFGGPPQLAVHGTNQPDLMGQAVSNGCIRVPNDLIMKIAEVVDLGTPVTVHTSRSGETA